MSVDYRELNVSEAMHRAIERMGFTEMTEVQEKAIGPMMEGRDVIAKAPTGTGKTCAFGIPLLEGIDAADKQVQALVLAPTRELCTQICEDLQDLAHFMPDIKIVAVYGGVSIEKQIRALKEGAQVVVATPGRLQDHMKRRTVDLSQVRLAVLDEADKMLDMGFYQDVTHILDRLKGKKQMAMFSATISRPVMDIGWLYQRDAVEVSVQPIEESKPKIRQYSILTESRWKLGYLTNIILKKGYRRTIIFCNTKYATLSLARQLAELNFEVDRLSGDMSQKERDQIMARFKEGKLANLVATDVAARGIDVDDVDAVFNYDVPEQNEYYTHRIGRTGRAKREGESYLLVTKDELPRLRDIIRCTGNEIIPVELNADRELVEVRDPRA